MTKIINIKDVKLNDYILFQEHNHIVHDDQLDCSNLYGKVIEIKTLDIIEGKTSISIKVQLDSMKYKEILEEYDNCLYFNFPHDEDNYDDTEVTLCNYTKDDLVNSLSDLSNQLTSNKTNIKETIETLKNVVSGYTNQIEKEETKDLKTYIAHIKVQGQIGCSVEAENEEQALQMFKDGEYEQGTEFSLSDCEICESELTLEDVDQLC